MKWERCKQCDSLNPEHHICYKCLKSGQIPQNYDSGMLVSIVVACVVVGVILVGLLVMQW